MNIEDALAEADDAVRYGDSVGPSVAEVLAAAVRRLRPIEQRALEVNGDPNSSNEAVEVSRYILGETS